MLLQIYKCNESVFFLQILWKSIKVTFNSRKSNEKISIIFGSFSTIRLILAIWLVPQTHLKLHHSRITTQSIVTVSFCHLFMNCKYMLQ